MLNVIDEVMTNIASRVGTYFRAVSRPTQNPLDIVFERDQDNRPFVKRKFDATVVWRTKMFPVISTMEERYCTALYDIDGIPAMILGRDEDVFFEYPQNVFLSLCVVYGDSIGVVDFCVDLLGEIAVAFCGASELPQGIESALALGYDSFSFNRSECSVELRVTPEGYKKVFDRTCIVPGVRNMVKMTLKQCGIAGAVKKLSEFKFKRPKVFVPESRETIREKLAETLTGIISRGSSPAMVTFAGKTRAVAGYGKR